MARGEVRIDPNDIVGKKIGKLEVRAYVDHWYDSTAGGQRMRHRYWVHCDCGVEKYVRRCQLLNESTKSCGCSRKEHRR